MRRRVAQVGLQRPRHGLAGCQESNRRQVEQIRVHGQAARGLDHRRRRAERRPRHGGERGRRPQFCAQIDRSCRGRRGRNRHGIDARLSWREHRWGGSGRARSHFRDVAHDFVDDPGLFRRVGCRQRRGLRGEEHAVGPRIREAAEDPEQEQQDDRADEIAPGHGPSRCKADAPRGASDARGHHDLHGIRRRSTPAPLRNGRRAFESCAVYRCPLAVPSRRGSAPPAQRPLPGAFANGAGAWPRIPLNTMPCNPLLMSTTATV